MTVSTCENLGGSASYDTDNGTAVVCLADGTCEHTAIVACEAGDGCCAPGCDIDNDLDCTACAPKNSACIADGDCCSNQCINDICRGE